MMGPAPDHHSVYAAEGSATRSVQDSSPLTETSCRVQLSDARRQRAVDGEDTRHDCAAHEAQGEHEHPQANQGEQRPSRAMSRRSGHRVEEVLGEQLAAPHDNEHQPDAKSEAPASVPIPSPRRGATSAWAMPNATIPKTMVTPAMNAVAACWSAGSDSRRSPSSFARS